MIIFLETDFTEESNKGGMQVTPTFPSFLDSPRSAISVCSGHKSKKIGFSTAEMDTSGWNSVLILVVTPIVEIADVIQQIE